jgi:hypothetical protein
MRVTVVVAERDGAKQSFALPVPRRLEFDIKLLVIRMPGAVGDRLGDPFRALDSWM